jgi:hypothetical protein
MNAKLKIKRVERAHGHVDWNVTVSVCRERRRFVFKSTFWGGMPKTDAVAFRAWVERHPKVQGYIEAVQWLEVPENVAYLEALGS